MQFDRSRSQDPHYSNPTVLELNDCEACSRATCFCESQDRIEAEDLLLRFRKKRLDQAKFGGATLARTDEHRKP